MPRMRERKVGERGRKVYSVCFVGGSKGGQTKELDKYDLLPELKYVIPPKYTATYIKDELPLLEQTSYKIETYIKTYNSFLDRYFYYEEEVYRSKQRLEKIRWHQQEISKHYEEISRLKFNI